MQSGLTPMATASSLVRMEPTTGGGSHCKFPGCYKPCFREPGGRVHDFCGRTHAQQYSIASKSTADVHVYTKQHYVNSSRTIEICPGGTYPILCMHYFNKWLHNRGRNVKRCEVIVIAVTLFVANNQIPCNGIFYTMHRSALCMGGIYYSLYWCGLLRFLVSCPILISGATKRASLFASTSD